MFRIASRRVSVFGLQCRQTVRCYSDASVDIRSKLTSELKSAMKVGTPHGPSGEHIDLSSEQRHGQVNNDSLLSEVYSADKTQPQPLASSAIISILRKAVARRADAAIEFDKASRPELASKERTEVDLLQSLLPPLLPESEIDLKLQEVITEQGITPGDSDSKKNLGKLFKGFYAKVDRSSVDPDLVKRRADALLTSQ
ncbi:hypothetical protein NLI96_g1461 [Meripilus lineatus]|uniref:Altered inheritance of mitochondria protein 41 n=1 Tax=Meripilus lineatus TaxID=2056292 RepID=A0AAD5YID3_9APHY|nr:hypothetical protein NLI96_g1461 [Physisporinus lineatus]